MNRKIYVAAAITATVILAAIAAVLVSNGMVSHAILTFLNTVLLWLLYYLAGRNQGLSECIYTFKRAAIENSLAQEAMANSNKILQSRLTIAQAEIAELQDETEWHDATRELPADDILVVCAFGVDDFAVMSRSSGEWWNESSGDLIDRDVVKFWKPIFEPEVKEEQ